MSAPHRGRIFEVCGALCGLGRIEGVGFVRFSLWFLLICTDLREHVRKFRFMEHCLFLGFLSLVHLFFMTTSSSWTGPWSPPGDMDRGADGSE